MSRTKPKILFFDLETRPLLAYLWSPGKQYVGHKQLAKGHDRPGIICVTYCWNDNRPAEAIDWGFEEQDTGRLVEKFDEILKTADHVIGKNNKRFDDKVLNACRMLNGLPGMPDWVRYTDDLEVQMRKYFRLPSQSLDYISNQLGLGGKIRMEMQDWIDIVEKNKNGPKALAKMVKYGKKDVVDTRKLWNRLSQHFEPKFNMATFLDKPNSCTKCGNDNIVKDGTGVSGFTKYQRYKCNKCGGYAGRTPISKVLRKEGKIR